MTLRSFELDKQLATLQAAQLLRHCQTISHGVTPYVWIDKKQYINFSSNDYLGMASHPAVLEVFAQNNSSVGAGAAHLVTGHTVDHAELETYLAQVTGCEAALLFSSGYMANVGVIDALFRAQREGVIYHDRLNHASLLDGARLAGMRTRRYPHQNMVQLNEWLQAETVQPRLITSDAIFSMDGTQAPIDELKTIAQAHQAALMIDDAHGFAIREQPYPAVDVYMATLGKAVGVYGAFVAGSSELIDFLRSQARTYLFTTAAPPILARAALRALHIIAQDTSIRTHLYDVTQQLREQLRLQGWQISPDQTAIIPLVVGSAQRALALSNHLRMHGIFAIPIRPPTVPEGQCRVRITVSANHQETHLEQLLTALALVKHDYIH